MVTTDLSRDPMTRLRKKKSDSDGASVNAGIAIVVPVYACRTVSKCQF